ncbi:diacylglycerol kinase family protein [Tsuneonella sp. YG55]|uniref:Diacylglycerol kinase family protein n=1 Tax=Tsuneonella litorea TaxID=2976475 RepID=A0A9X2W327_9SPHN|nr:diacylglycerol kinase family protein [Tsuneonella litorea]MCT2559926.1 diacylglycerol kinase family protein [Tsuneonella litorea]
MASPSIPSHDRPAAGVGVIFNPRSHRNAKLRASVAALPGVHVAAPSRRGDLRAVLDEFIARGVGCIAISGGDGTVRDVLTAGLPLFGENWPELAVIPAGKTNALNADLGAPKDWNVAGVIAAREAGRRIVRRPLVVRDCESGAELAGFIFGAGIFTTAIAAGQDAHRLGAFDSLAVGATTAWGVLQALFGTDRNLWRRGIPMTIRTGEERRELPRSRWGDPARRTMMLASTLDRFPAGTKPFARLEGMKLAVIDHPRRRVMAAIPAIAAGWDSEWLAPNGFHRCATDRIEIDLDGRFILDGEAFPPGRYAIVPGPALSFVVP